MKRATAAAAITSESIPDIEEPLAIGVAKRLGIARRKLALVKSTAAAVHYRGDRALQSKVASIVAAAEAATDQLDRAGAEVIRQTEALVQQKQLAQPVTRSAGEQWNEQPFIADVAWRARGEVDSYVNLHKVVASVNGLLELLVHLTESVESGAAVNWTVIQAAIKDARDRLGPAYCATGILAELDQEAEADEDAGDAKAS